MRVLTLLGCVFLSAAVSATPLTAGRDTWTLGVEGTSPGSGEVYDTDKFQTLPGFNHLLRNQSAEAGGRVGEGDDDDGSREYDSSEGITLEGVCRHMNLAGQGKIGETTLEAQCVDEYAYWWNTTLNLNECVTNADGRLAYMEDGEFDASCQPCFLSDLKETEGLLLKCNCMRGDEPFYSSLPLGSHVDHPRTVRPVGGRLMCGDRLGSKTPSFSVK